MVTVLVDTSVIIEKIRTKKGLFDTLITKAKSGNCRLYTSVIVLTELWMGKSMKYKGAIDEVETILKSMVKVTVDGEVGRKAGILIRKQHVGGFDGLIAATALVHKAELATLNTKHFKKIKGLKLFNE